MKPFPHGINRLGTPDGSSCNQVLTFLKYGALIVVLIVLAGILFMAVLFAQWFWLPEAKAATRDRALISQVRELAVRPAADWVRTFYQQHGRLPANSEFEAYAAAKWPNYYFHLFDTPPSRQHSWGRAGVDFMLLVHMGEWSLYYQSWDGKEWKVWTD